MDRQGARGAQGAVVEQAAPGAARSSLRRVLVQLAAPALVTLALTLFAAGVAAYHRKLSAPPYAVSARLDALGLPIGVYAAYLTTVVVVFGLVCFAVAALITWRQPNRPMRRFVALFLVLLASANAPLTGALTEQHPGWADLVTLTFGLMGICLTHFLFLFPDGHFVPARMRLPVRIWAAALLLALLLPPLSEIGYLLLLAGFVSGVVAQVHRYRRVSNRTQRQQTKWVVFGGALALAGQLAFVLLGALAPSVFPLAFEFAGYDPLAVTLVALSYMLIPASIGIAILRSRLWDIDLLIHRTLVYGALTAGVIGLYVLVVGGASALLRTGDHLPASLVATGLIAVLFQPLRERLQRGLNRLLYGERDDPYAVLARLGHQLEVALAPEAILVAMVATVAHALKLPRAAIWLCDGDLLRLGAMHGGRVSGSMIHDGSAIRALRGGARTLLRSDFDAAGAFHAALAEQRTELVLPLTYRGELAGALCLAPWGPDEWFSVADMRLLRALASQCGAAAHAVQLTTTLRASLEELRQSRERLVLAQEEERRRIQRDLHDGLGPTLASMRFRLEACLGLAEGASPALIGMLERLDELVGQATGDIRRLVYDLRPPALDQLGLVPALQHHIQRFSRETGIAIQFSVEPALAIPASAEVSMLRIVQEALVNVRKHARASRVDVQLRYADDVLVLVIEDDGVGFGTESTPAQGGAGLGSMRERAELLGGTLRLAPRDGGGTELLVRVPLGGS